MFITTGGRIFTVSAVKSLSDNSNISAVTVLLSTDYLFTFILVLGRMNDFFFLVENWTFLVLCYETLDPI